MHCPSLSEFKSNCQMILRWCRIALVMLLLAIPKSLRVDWGVPLLRYLSRQIESMTLQLMLQPINVTRTSNINVIFTCLPNVCAQVVVVSSKFIYWLYTPSLAKWLLYVLKSLLWKVSLFRATFPPTINNAICYSLLG